MSRKIIGLLFLLGTYRAPAQGVQSFVGTVVNVRAESMDTEIHSDSGESRLVRISVDTLILKVTPGETNLKNAGTIQLREIAAGDRVLVSLESGNTNARRIVAMPVADITKRDQADQQDWIDRGISGVVTGKSGK